MRVFLTGATGYVGSAVLDALIRGGHEITALVRNPENAEELARRGVQPVLGTLAKPSSFAEAAEACDGTIHTAFDQSKQGEAIDRLAIETLTAAVRRKAAGAPARQPFFVYTSGVWVLGKATRPATEDAALNPTPLVAWRPPHETMALDAGKDGAIRTAVVRPGIVYGGARGIIGDLVRDATNGLLRVIGSGKQHWPCVYDRDLADVYARLVARDDASGIFHVNDEADERVIDIVEALAAHVKMRPDIRHVPLPEARAKLGVYADALALDQKVRSPRARALGWTPSLHSVAGSVARLLEEYRNGRRQAA